MNLNSNWMKDLRTEVFRRMYEEPIHPANLWLEQHPKSHAEVDEVYRANIQRLIDRGTFTPPAHPSRAPGTSRLTTIRRWPAGSARERSGSAPTWTTRRIE